MSEVLYRKYRSKTLEEVVGQPHITKTLSNAIKSNNIAHAYLFTGPRGVGKTSIARILAYKINDIPYELDSSHLDVIEIDAASNRRIDEIRDLREKVHIAPTSAKYKVYIIDEVHMLTKEAFNALLKTLEEPPAHAIFILATTESHKVPETIISRTQRFSFKHITPQTIAGHLNKIAKIEKINISTEALDLIAEHSNGSFRDAISMLDQIRGIKDSAIGKADVELFLGIAPQELIVDLYDSLTSSPKLAIETLQNLRDQGVQSVATAKQLMQIIRYHSLENDLPKLLNENYTNFSRSLLEVQNSIQPDIELEIICVGLAIKNQIAPTVLTPRDTPVESPQKIQDLASDPVEEPETLGTILPEMLEIWQKVLAAIKSNHNTLYSFLRMVRPEFSENKLTLYAKFPFHQKRLSDSKNLAIIT